MRSANIAFPMFVTTVPAANGISGSHANDAGAPSANQLRQSPRKATERVAMPVRDAAVILDRLRVRTRFTARAVPVAHLRRRRTAAARDDHTQFQRARLR